MVWLAMSAAMTVADEPHPPGAQPPPPLPLPPSIVPLPPPPAPATAPIRLTPMDPRAARFDRATSITTRPTTRSAVTTSQPATQPAEIIYHSIPAAASYSDQLGKVVVTSEDDVPRDLVPPSLGAVAYTVGPEQIQTTPGGENATFQQVLLRAPGVVADSFGEEHVRGEHGNLTYRVNGVTLPEPLNGFGQEVDTRLVQSLTLIDGSLPAQFGLHTAGVVDITTKSGETLRGNQLSFYGGSNDSFNPSVQFGGTLGKLDYFITASYNHNDFGIENPTASHRALHDYTDQEKIFGYLSYRVDDSSRLSLLLNASDSDFQIPDSPGIQPAFNLAGHPTADSAKINENQNEQEYYSVLSFQKTIGKLTYNVSAFARYGQIKFVPDPVNDLIYQGVAGKVVNSFVTSGTQLDSSYVLSDQHTLRAGFIADYTTELLSSNTAVFFTSAATGQPTSTEAVRIPDSSGNRAWESGAYLQDEWRISSKLTLNYGLRYDRFDANFDTEDQFSPRVNMVYKLDEATTAHAGYARYFVTPPVQDVTLATLGKFSGTTNAPSNLLDGPPKVERSNYYDLGISRQVSKPWTVGLDGFYKQSKNLIDLGQFGQAVILSPYNYRAGTVYGAEFSSTYKQGGFTAFGNFSWVETMAHDIDSQQFEIDNPELNYIKYHNIKLDHEGEFTVSTGASHARKDDRVSIDLLYGSGLRAGFANTHQQPSYYPVNLGYEHVFHPKTAGGHTVKFRLDITNVFDESYQLRNGSGIGVGAPQYGQRRTFMAGLTYSF